MDIDPLLQVLGAFTLAGTLVVYFGTITRLCRWPRYNGKLPVEWN